jgi:SpoVK/Ycf46/Vps4 family AAA+-type ATPase
LPDAAARIAILRHHLRDQAFDGDLARFASATRGWSGADIEKLARDARRLSRRRKVALSEDLLLEVMPARYVLSASELRTRQSMKLAMPSSRSSLHATCSNTFTSIGMRPLEGALSPSE